LSNNTESSLKYATFELPLPTNKNGLKLMFDDFRIAVFDADANNYVSVIYIKGVSYDNEDTIASDATHRTSQGLHVTATAAVDCSSYEVVRAVVGIDGDGTAAAIDLGALALQCYYDDV